MTVSIYTPKNFQEKDSLQKLYEKQLIIGDHKNLINSNNGQVLIVAGGPASGKTTVIKDVIGFNGKVFSSDDIKDKLLKFYQTYP